MEPVSEPVDFLSDDLPTGPVSFDQPTPEPSYIPSTDGVEVAVHELGGDGELLILSHATGFCGRVWEPVADALAVRFRCIALDYRGHGHTKTPEHITMDWSGMGQDLLAVIRAYSPDQAVFVAGHSMGGAAITIAADEDPNAIRRAWGFEPILISPELYQARTDGAGTEPNLAEGARRRRPEFASRAEAYQRYRAKPPLGLLDPRALAAYVQHGFVDTEAGTVRLRCEPHREAEIFEASGSNAFDAAGRIGFDYRVLISGDGGGPAKMAEIAASQHQRMSMARFNELTHFGPMEQPELIAVDILEWFMRR